MEAGEIETELRKLAEPIVAGEGLELVEVVLKGAPGRRLVRLDIDRPGTAGVDLAECQRVSRAMEQKLDEVDLIDRGYVLEVSSPGVDRPIRSADDIRRNTGRRIVVTSVAPGGGRCMHRGVLLGCDAGEIRLRGEDGGEIRVALDGVVEARQEVAF